MKTKLVKWLERLAKNIQQLSLDELLATREAHGFTTFIPELSDPSFDEARPTWQLVGGTLTVQYQQTAPLFNPKELLTYLNSCFQGLNLETYESVAPHDFLEAPPAPYQLPFKALKKYGPNQHACAVVFIWEPNNQINILTIRKPDNTITLPSALEVVENVATTCIEVLARQCFNLRETTSAFRNLLMSNMKVGEPSNDLANPSNTDLAWVVKTPAYMFLGAHALNRFPINSTSDEQTVTLTPIDAFCLSDHVSDHDIQLVLEGLANRLEARELMLSHTLQTQLKRLSREMYPLKEPTLNRYFYEHLQAKKRVFSYDTQATPQFFPRDRQALLRTERDAPLENQTKKLKNQHSEGESHTAKTYHY